MKPSVNIASLISVRSDDDSGLFVMDAASGKFYRLDLREADAATTGRLTMAVRGQMRENMPYVPHDQIAEVMRAEREVTEAGSKSAFERG